MLTEEEEEERNRTEEIHSRRLRLCNYTNYATKAHKADARNGIPHRAERNKIHGVG